jgi:hypothetical protein
MTTETELDKLRTLADDIDAFGLPGQEAISESISAGIVLWKAANDSFNENSARLVLLALAFAFVMQSEALRPASKSNEEIYEACCDLLKFTSDLIKSLKAS